MERWTQISAHKHSSASIGDGLIVDVNDPPGARLYDNASIVDNTILISVRARYLGHEPVRQWMKADRSRQVASYLGVEAWLVHGIKVLAPRVLMQNGPVFGGEAHPVSGAVVRRRHVHVLGRNARG